MFNLGDLGDCLHPWSFIEHGYLLTLEDALVTH